jgi:hypothetical protein
MVREWRQSGELLTIDVVDLSWPEEQQNKVITTTEEGDKEDDDHGLLGLVENCPRNHGVWSIYLPYEEGDYQYDTKNERYDVVWAAPLILQSVSTEMQSA